MSRLLLVTQNKHKLEEIEKILDRHIQIQTLDTIGFSDEIPETSGTIEGNASQKAWFIYNQFHIDCFADDSGLEVKALDGRPGVHSARYAGTENDFDKNMTKLLDELKGFQNREAQFRTVICLILQGREYLFEGKISGTIIHERKGRQGFGYDPVFLPDGFDKTFAEMKPEEKNDISHRSIAIRKMSDFLLSMIHR